jgi:uncharacterized membrane protein
MEILLFLALTVIFIIVLNIQGRQRSNADQLNKRLSDLTSQVQDLKKELQNKHIEAPPVTDAVQQQAQKEAAELKAQEEYKQKITAIEELRRIKEEKRKTEEQLLHQRPVVTVTVAETIDIPTESPKRIQPPPPKESWLEKWFKNNPDLEKFIGENLFNKIGIAVLVFGIGFFVKYAIDKDWINEYGRVAIGLFCGIVLVGLAHYLRKTYRSFSSVLAGGGIAVFYFTIALAFHEYQIITQPVAFILMIVITAFAIILALLYDKLELAVIAAVGGFLTPFLVSTGDGNYIVLFTYLIILNIGLLALAWFKKWPLVNMLSLFFTILIYGGWMLDRFLFKSATPPYANALLFASIFYSIFLGMNMVYNIRRQHPFKAFDFFILLLINVTYYSAGMVLLTGWHSGAYKGLFTVAMGVINFALALYFFKKHKADKNLLYLLIGLTLTYLTLAAPVQLHGHSITLFWCAETVLLFWLFQRSQIQLFKLSSSVIALLAVISLLMDWQQAGANSSYTLPVIFTGIKGIVTNGVAISALVLYHILLRREENNSVFLFGIPNRVVANIFITAAVVLAYSTCWFGINLYFGKELSYTLPNIYHRLLSNLFALVLVLLVLPKLDSKKISGFQIAAALACFILYAGSGPLITSLRNGVIAGQYSNTHLLMHWLSDASLLLLFYTAIRVVRKNFTALKKYVQPLGFVISIALVYFFSFECMQLYVTALADTKTIDVFQQQYSKAGLTILWGISSFIMIWLGMKHRYKPLRIISIGLFAIALLKLFLSDITNIGPGGKIAAFILLGVLLLTVSFMYQRLKKLLIDDTEK